MKKNLLFGVLFAATIANAQFTDDMESYSLGPVHAGHWNSWDGSAGGIDAIATDYRANSGTQSMYIGPGQTQDAILDLGNKTFGVWTINYKLYVPTDSTGYYNFQEVTPVGSGAYAINVFFNEGGAANGSGVVYDDANPANSIATFTFPNDAWFDVEQVINLGTDSIFMKVNGTSIYSGPFYSGGNLGGIDFFSIDAVNAYYIDDVVFSAGAVGIQETEQDLELSVYPNPVNDILNVTAGENITNVTVYDLAGKVVKNNNYNALSVTVNTDDLPNGSYVAKITMGEESKMVKVLK